MSYSENSTFSLGLRRVQKALNDPTPAKPLGRKPFPNIWLPPRAGCESTMTLGVEVGLSRWAEVYVISWCEPDSLGQFGRSSIQHPGVSHLSTSLPSGRTPQIGHPLGKVVVAAEHQNFHEKPLLC